MKYIITILITFSINSATYAAATSPGNYNVLSRTLNVRLAASKGGKVIKNLYKNQQVEVFEINGEWARISPYHDGTAEAVPGNVAHWVFALFLIKNSPAEEKIEVKENTKSVNTAVAHAATASPEKYNVLSRTLNVRSAASKNGKVIKKLHKNQTVEVFEINGEWARISPNDNGITEDVSGNAAHWVSAQFLIKNSQVEEKPQVKENTKSVITPVTYDSTASPENYNVISRTLNVRSAASKDGRVIKNLYKNQPVEVLEINGEWARISPYYDGTAEGVPGNAAHWVSSKYLIKNRQVKENTKSVNTEVARAIRFSEDFSKYYSIFISASEKLINNGSCKLADFKEMGGWWRALNHKPKPVYVTYCGDRTDSNRIYLDATTGAIFR